MVRNAVLSPHNLLALALCASKTWRSIVCLFLVTTFLLRQSTCLDFIDPALTTQTLLQQDLSFEFHISNIRRKPPSGLHGTVPSRKNKTVPCYRNKQAFLMTNPKFVNDGIPRTASPDARIPRDSRAPIKAPHDLRDVTLHPSFEQSCTLCFNQVQLITSLFNCSRCYAILPVVNWEFGATSAKWRWKKIVRGCKCLIRWIQKDYDCIRQ